MGPDATPERHPLADRSWSYAVEGHPQDVPRRDAPCRPLTNLRALRERAGLSQDELGSRASISQSKVSRIERGYLQANLEERARLASALGVETDALSDATGVAHVDVSEVR
jgi:predicted transcriptional regulator